MNVTQLLAWIICLALAFFAGLLAARNSVKTAMLEKQFAAVQAAAVDQTAALHEVSATLRQIEEDLKAGSGPAAGSGSAANGGAAVEQLSRQVQQLRERVEAIEGRGAAPQTGAPAEAK
jgi:hypothetical protein